MTRRWLAVCLSLLAGCGTALVAQAQTNMTNKSSPLDPFLQKLLDEAAAMPLMDAAFQLWRWKSNFDRNELPSPPPVDTKDPEIAAKLMQADFTTRYRFERANAHDGITFDRMKRIHPRAADADVKAAITAAVKLDDDCHRHFDRDYKDFSAALDSALEKATRENPGYLPTTYRSAGSFLFYNMK
jgi:hypothetical protein